MEKVKVFFKRISSKKYLIPIIVTVAVISAMSVVFLKAKTVTVDINGVKTKFVSFSSTVGKALKSKDIALSSKDKVSPALNSKLVNGEVIDIKRAVNVNVTVDGKNLKIKSAEDNIGLMLSAEGITLSSEDRVKPDEDVKLSEGMQIDIVRVETKIIYEIQPVNFEETVKYDSGVANTKRNVLHQGANGEKKITYKAVYEDGIEVSRKAISEDITKQPVDRVILQGTYPLMPVSRGGSLLPYSKVIRVKATAYWAVNGVGRTYTASGRKAVRNPDGYSTIAVDHNLIPYGTKLFVEGYGFAIAADTGTGIIGNRIDVFFNTYREACSYGAKYVKVYILN